MANATTTADAHAFIDSWAARLGNDPELREQIFQATAKARLGGSLFVYDVELARAHSEPVAFEETPPDTFLNLPFNEAIDHFLARRVVDPEEFYRLLDEDRANAFTAARATSDVVRDQMKAHLDAAVAPDGPGLRDFQREFLEDVTSPLTQTVDESDASFQRRRTRNSRSYLETVYRTTIGQSYGEGRLQAQQDPDVIEALPFWQYRTAGDSRVRDSHAELDGKIFRANSPEGLANYPGTRGAPDDFNDRCVMVALSENAARAEGYTGPV